MILINENSRVDLHIHSNASDGTLSPEEIVKEALKKDIKLIALTDHDEMKNIQEIKAVALEHGIGFLPGIEVSSTFNGNLHHILAYGTDNSNKELIELLEENRNALEKRNDDSIKHLIKKGYEIDYEDYIKYEHDKTKGGWKALNYLVDREICKDVNDYFNRLYFGEKHILFPLFTSTEKVIKVIKKAGGIAILAHPYYEKDTTPVYKKLEDFFKIGIDGIECFHPNHSIEIIKECLKWCKDRKLISTAGSDFHGGFISTRFIGEPEARIKDIELGRILEKIVT